jgi:uncharacterized membrane protein YbhN (UPF0104 family)
MTRRLWPWLRMLIAVAILAVLVWRLGTDAFVDGLRRVNPPALLAALGIGLFTTVLSVWRWRLVASRLGLPLPPLAALADYYRSLFLNAALPVGVLGDAHRAVVHGRSAGDVGRAVRAVVLERSGGQIVLFAAGAVVLVADPSPAAAIARGLVPDPGVLAAAAAVLAVLAAAVLWARRRGGAAEPPARGASRWRDAIARSITATVADLRAGLLARDTWPGVFALSAAVLAGHVTMFLVAARTAGVDAPVARLVPLVLLALLVMGLPVNVGGWGPREAFAAAAFGAVGLGAEQGLATSVVYGVLAFVASLPGAVVLVLRRGTRAGGADRVGQADGAGRTDRAGDPAAVPARAGLPAELPSEHGEVAGERRDEAVDHALSLPGRGQ